MNILFLSRWYPYPPDNGSKIRIYSLLRNLSQYYEISLISFFNPSEGTPKIDELSDYCREIELVSYRPFQPLSKHSLVGFLSPRPRNIVDTFSKDIRDKIAHAFSKKIYDLVIASQFDMAIYGEYFQKTPAIFDEAEIGVYYERFSNAKSRLQELRYRMTWEKYRRYLRALLKHYQACTVVSSKELNHLKLAVPGYESIHIIPNFIDPNDYEIYGGTTQQKQIIFTGSFTYHPNYEAMCWFLNEVYPIIRSQDPDIHLIITGDPSNKALPGRDGVTHVGYVDDIRSYIARAGCSIVPILTGGGSRLKVLEAMALGTPVVATTKGAEGLDVHHGKHLLVADSPESFADAVIQILQDPHLRKNLTDNAYQLINNKYSSTVIIPKYLNLIEKIILNAA